MCILWLSIFEYVSVLVDLTKFILDPLGTIILVSIFENIARNFCHYDMNIHYCLKSRVARY